jgi:hypothetical protein
MDRTALSYWFPKLLAAGLPVPKTAILQMPRDAQEEVWAAFDGKEGPAPGAMKTFCDTLCAAMAPMRYPCFLRTDYTSGKHNWKRTCFVPHAASIGAHVFAIAEFSECADIMGLPWDTWAVREFLPTRPLGICPNYGDMPICREFRYFVDGADVKCWHPYWPVEALNVGGAEGIDYDALCKCDYEAALGDMAAAAGHAVGGAWSVDILETERGWFITDMAEAHKSFHWKGCPKG